MDTADKAELEAMIEEATVDAYNEDEQLTGLFTMLEEHIDVPFTTAFWPDRMASTMRASSVAFLIQAPSCWV